MEIGKTNSKACIVLSKNMFTLNEIMLNKGKPVSGIRTYKILKQQLFLVIRQ